MSAYQNGIIICMPDVTCPSSSNVPLLSHHGAMLCVLWQRQGLFLDPLASEWSISIFPGGISQSVKCHRRESFPSYDTQSTIWYYVSQEYDSSTYSYSSPSITIYWSLEEICLQLAPFIFISQVEVDKFEVEVDKFSFFFNIAPYRVECSFEVNDIIVGYLDDLSSYEQLCVYRASMSN